MRSWNRIEKSLLIAFLLWSGAGLLFTVLQITPHSIGRSSSIPSWLGAFIRFCLEFGDPILILLAFANTHLHAARQWSPAVARRWGAMILVAAFAV